MSTSGTDSVPSLRRPVLNVTITTFTLAAVMGVIALLSGGFGETQVRVLLTTLLVGTASVCVLCYLASAGTPYRGVGYLGGAALVLPVVTGLTLIWGEVDVLSDDGWLKAFGVGCVLAATAAQVSLLLGLAWDRSALGVPLWGTVAVAALLAVLLTGIILGESVDEGTWRLVGVLAILDVLGTLITIALAKFGGARAPAPAAPEVLVLPHGLEDRLTNRARELGRPRADLLAEAVEQYLTQPHA